MSIRARFTVTVVAIMAVTIALFAGLSIVALDRALRSGLGPGCAPQRRQLR